MYFRHAKGDVQIWLRKSGKLLISHFSRDSLPYISNVHEHSRIHPCIDLKMKHKKRFLLSCQKII